MKTRLILVLCIIIMHLSVIAQVKIGNNPTSINSASLLELETTNQGFVLPRVSITDVSSSSPLAAGLLTGTVVYNTNSTTTGGSGTGIYLWDGTKWVFISTGSAVSSSAWLLTGNSGLNASTNFMGTTDAVDFVARTNNTERMRILGANSGSSKAGWIGIGIAVPRSSLDVTGDYTNKNVLTLQNTSSTGFTSVDMLDNTGALKGTFGYANTGTGGSFGGRTYFNSYGSDLLFTANSGTYHLFLQGGTGYIGVNTNTPSERLHVVGNFYLTGAFMPGGSAGTLGYILTSAGAGTAPTWNNLNGLSWNLAGNSGTSYATNFLGTTDNKSMRFRTNNVQRMIIDSLGRVGIGINNPTYALSVLSASNPLYLSGVQATSTFSTDSVLTINAGVVKKAPYSSLSGISWNLTGNAGTNSAINFLGTTDNHPLKFEVNNTIAGYIDSSGALGSTFFGSNAGYKNTTGNGNTFIGAGADSLNSTGSSNTATGYQTGYNNTSGSSNIFTGYQAGYNNTTASGNIFTGFQTGYKNTTGQLNMFSGYWTGYSNTTGSNNVFTGYLSGFGNTTGGNNIFIGSQAGSTNTTGSKNTLIGGNSNVLSAGLNNAAAIGYNAKVALSNSLVLGDTISGGSAVNVGIGVRNPLKRLHIDAAPISIFSVGTTDSLKIDNLATSASSFRKSVLVIDSTTGYVSKQSLANLTSNIDWSLTGNSGTNYATNFLGTTDNVSLRLRTNNTEQMIIDSLGSVGIGSEAFDPYNPAKLLVDYGTTTSNSIVNLKGNIDDYLQINLKNNSNGGNASSDYVATADDGTDSTYYVDMGINSSNYAFSVDNWGGAHDAYLYSNSKNLYIGTQAIGSDVIFLVGGGRAVTNSALRIRGNTGNVVIGKGDVSTTPVGNIIRGPNGLGTNIAGGSLTIQGGASTGTAAAGTLYLRGGIVSGLVTGSTVNNAPIIMSTSSTERMRIDSVGNVGIGTTNPGYKLSVLAGSNPLYLSGVQATGTFTTDSILTIYNGVVKKAPSGATLNSFSVTAPLTYDNTTGVFGINQATTSTDGYLSSTDWNTFNNKVSGITLNAPSIFSTPVNFSVASGAATGTLSLNTQTVGTVFAGPAGPAGLGGAVPTFRALVASDIPSLASSYIQNQSTVQASSNFYISGNGTIGTNLAVTGTSTLTGAVTSKAGITNTGILTSSGGIANVNASSNFATNINTGTSTGTVTLGNALNNINLPKLSASSVVLTDASKNLTSTTPSSNTYLYYNGTNFTWATAASSLAALTNGNGIASLNYNGSTSAIVSLANGTAGGQVYVTGASPYTPSLVTMSGDATISGTGALSLAAVNSNVGTFNNVTVNAKGLITAASNLAYTTLGSFSTTAPLTYDNTTGVFGINQATTSTDGYLSLTNWNTFNNKVGSITLNAPSIFTTPVNFAVSSGSAIGTLSLNTQTANTVFAGPSSGSAATPTFRALVAADIPTLSDRYIQNQTTQQASSNFSISGNGAIGNSLTVVKTSSFLGPVASGSGITNTGLFTTASGAISLNINSNYATNINTGTSTGTVTLGNSLNNINLPKLSASSVVLTDASKNLTSTTPSSNTYLYYNGTNFTWATAASSLASLTNGNGIASLNYNSSSPATVSLANGSAGGQVYVTNSISLAPSLVTMSGDATITGTGALSLATVNSNEGIFNNVTVNAKGLVTAASNLAYTTLGSFSATAPLIYNNTTGVFGINQSSASVDGYLSSTDWNIFNNKVGSITLNAPSIFSTPVNFSVASGAATGTLSLNTEAAATVFAGPVTSPSGGAPSSAIPTFRALVASDIPSLASSYIQNQSTVQASSNFNISGNGTIGTNLGVTGTSTLTGAVTSKAGITNTGIFTSSGGIANVNASSNFATNINTGTSSGTVTVGGVGNNIILPKFKAVGGLYYTSLNTGQITTTGSNMTWDSINNRLGIGISSPGYKLSVLSSSDPLYLSGVQETAVFNTDSVLTIYNGVVKKAPTSSLANVDWSLTGNSATSYTTSFLGTTDNVSMRFRTNNTERLIIDSLGSLIVGNGDLSTLPTGNVVRGPNGLGTNIAGGSLTLQGGAGTGKAAAGGNLYLNGGTSGGSIFGAGSTNALIGPINGSIIMNTANLERMRITGTGNVGIGTSSPSYKLQVLSSSDPLYLSGVQATSSFTTDSILTINAGVVKKTSSKSFDSAYWKLTGNSGTSGATNFLGTTNNVSLHLRTNNTERMIIDSLGNVGIGTSTPNTGTKLDVAGSFKLGTAGSVLSGMIKSSVTVTPTVNLGTTTTYTATVTGATTGASVIINPRNTLASGVVIAYSYVSAADTITIAFTSGGTTGSLGAQTFDVTIIQ